MKKLISILLVLLVPFMISCGAAPECECEDIEHCFEETKEDFFETYYAHCFDLCSQCTVWAESCNVQGYTADSCTYNRWYSGSTNAYCITVIPRIESMILEEVCDGQSESECLDYR
jgi:hypothetical protein